MPTGTLHRILLLILILVGFASAQESDSTLVRLLKSGRVPEDRQATVIEMIGKRGTSNDLGYLYQRVLKPDGFSPPLRQKALGALVEAVSARQIKPSGDLGGLRSLLASTSDMTVRLDAIRLAGYWKIESAIDDLRTLITAPATEAPARLAAVDALATMDTDRSRQVVESLSGPDMPPYVRVPAVAALARFAPDKAARLAAIVVQDAKPDIDLTPLVAAFVNRQDGPEKLAETLAGVAIPADAAKRALRALYTLGRSDGSLVAVLSKAAGIDAEVKPLDPSQMERFIAEVAQKGNPERGEAVFRRADVNCGRCHALLGAGGGIGPDLSPIGQSSPVDYIVNSLLLPDQAIKEEFHTLVVLTSEGQVYQGIVVNRDDNRIVLKEATGDVRTVPTSSIEETKEGGSLMPKGLTNLLTHDEFVDLVRFLSELGKPGPYALRPIPTIQRWRVLRPVPEALKGDVPRVEAIRTEILESSTASWTPVYATFSGTLPLGDLALDEDGSSVLYVQGEIEVSESGPVEFQLDSREGTHIWINDRDFSGQSKLVTRLEPGRTRLTLRIDLSQRKSSGLRVAVNKPAGSQAEFTVVGGP